MCFFLNECSSVKCSPRLSFCLISLSNQFDSFYPPEPSYVTMTANSVIASSKEAFYAWQYKSVKKLTTLELQSNTNKHGKKEGSERSVSYYFIYLLFFGYFIHYSFFLTMKLISWKYISFFVAHLALCYK